jgi:cysteinyl-tRNA synthetase
MSKSKGNYYTLTDLVEKGYSPMALRYALLMGHPQKQLNFTMDSLHAAQSALKRLSDFDLQTAAAFPDREVSYIEFSKGYKRWGRFEPVWNVLCDGLNTPAAFGVLFSIMNEIKAGDLTFEDRAGFERIYQKALGFNFPLVLPVSITPPEITALAAKRWAAKQAKDFAAADALRKELTAAGWSMLDSKTDYKLEPLKK